MSASFSRTSASVVSPKLRTSNNCSSVRVTRSRTVVMFSDSRQLVARTDSSNSARLMPSLASVAWSMVDRARARVSLWTIGPSSLYCTNGLRCLRRILADSTRAISGETEPLVQISMVSLS